MAEAEEPERLGWAAFQSFRGKGVVDRETD